MPESLQHPVFGQLRWEEKYSWWFTQFLLPSGGWLDVIVDPGDNDRYAFIEPAAQLFRRALKAERRILRDALREELLELYNDTWRHSDEPKLTATGLMKRLMFTLIDLNTVVPVTLSYAAGDLFGGHGVAVEVDDEMQFQDTDLRG